MTSLESLSLKGSADEPVLSFPLQPHEEHYEEYAALEPNGPEQRGGSDRRLPQKRVP